MSARSSAHRAALVSQQTHSEVHAIYADCSSAEKKMWTWGEKYVTIGDMEASEAKDILIVCCCVDSTHLSMDALNEGAPFPHLQ